MKKIAILLLLPVVLLFFAISGCDVSQTTPSLTDIANQEDVDSAVTTPPDDLESETSEGQSTDQPESISGDEVATYYDADYFASDGENFYPLKTLNYNADGNFTLDDGSKGVIFRDESYNYDEEGPVENWPRTVHASTGQFLVTNNGLEEVQFRQVVDTGYTLTMESVGSGVQYDEINGVAVDGSATEFLSSEYEVIRGYVTNPTYDSITVGYYLGTKFHETEMYFDVPFCTCSEVSYTVPVEKTKNGYFIVDISSIPSGTYLVSVVNQDPMIIIID